MNSTYIYLSWDTPPPSEINGIIREYRLNITEDATGSVFQYSTSASIQEITIGSLHPYYIYHCTVVAYTVEEGPYTSIFTIQTEEDSEFSSSLYTVYFLTSYYYCIVPGGPPTVFVASADDSRTINLTWSAPNPEEQNGILRYYLVTLTSILPTEVRNISFSQLSIAITDLRPYTVYTCIVSAGTIGLGPSTIIRQVLTPEDGKYLEPHRYYYASEVSSLKQVASFSYNNLIPHEQLI